MLETLNVPLNPESKRICRHAPLKAKCVIVKPSLTFLIYVYFNVQEKNISK